MYCSLSLTYPYCMSRCAMHMRNGSGLNSVSIIVQMLDQKQFNLDAYVSASVRTLQLQFSEASHGAHESWRLVLYVGRCLLCMQHRGAKTIFPDR